MPHHLTGRQHAFTLIEILATIAIIAVLIAIAVPVLGSAMRNARRAKSLANARSIAQQFELYASANETYPHTWRGAMPPATVDDVGYEVPWYPPGWVSSSSLYWNLSEYWPGLIADPQDWPGQFETWVSPGRRAELPTPPTPEELQESFVSYVYAQGFLGDPRLWTDKATFDWQLARAVRPSEVESPSGKVMLWDRHLGWAGEVEREDGHAVASTPMAFADGHAAAHLPLDATAGVANILNDSRDTRLHNTPEGVRGRDY